MAVGHVERGQNGFLKTTRAGEMEPERTERDGKKEKADKGFLPSTEERNERRQVGQASKTDKD